MRIGVLGSGSGGNAVVVESGPHRLLIDAGFSCRELVKRMARLNFDPATLGGLVITHEHQDHRKGAQRFSRRFKLPVYGTAGTLDGSGLRGAAVPKAVEIRSGEPFEVPGFHVEPFAIPHDAREPVGFVVEDSAGRRVGLASDLGSRSQLAWARLRELDLLLLEYNHDLEMLRNGPYPWHLKQRISSGHGHLSNRTAAEGMPDLLCDRLRFLVLYHLSRTNNLPALALAAAAEALSRERAGAELVLSDQFEPSSWLEIA